MMNNIENTTWITSWEAEKSCNERQSRKREGKKEWADGKDKYIQEEKQIWEENEDISFQVNNLPFMIYHCFLPLFEMIFFF